MAEISSGAKAALAGPATEGHAVMTVAKHLSKSEHGDKLKNAEAHKKGKLMADSAKAHLASDDYANRQKQGEAIGHAIVGHLKDTYPNHHVVSVHVTNKNGMIGHETGGKHDDDHIKNPSDLIVKLKHKKTGEEQWHGYSLKAGEKGHNKGMKNPTPKHMDKALGTKASKIHDMGKEELHSQFPTIAAGKNKDEKKEAHDNLTAKQKSKVTELKNTTFRNVRDHMVDTINKHAKTKEGNEKVKHFFKNTYYSSASMPVHKASVAGSHTSKAGIKTKIDDLNDDKGLQLLHHPDSKVRAVKSNSDSYMHVHVQNPETKKWHHAFSEQVKSSSGWHYSSARHNVYSGSGKEVDDK